MLCPALYRPHLSALQRVWRRHHDDRAGARQGFGRWLRVALACDMIIAERSSTFSFPESLFGLFPGMGALSFLSRKIGLAKAEKICSSADVFSADEMFALGVVDRVVDDGTGLESTKRLITQRQRHANTYRAMKAAKSYCMPITHEELINIVDVWTDAAMRLDTRDLRMMARLVKAQDRLLVTSPEEQAIQNMFSQDAAVAAMG